MLTKIIPKTNYSTIKFMLTMANSYNSSFHLNDPRKTEKKAKGSMDPRDQVTTFRSIAVGFSIHVLFMDVAVVRTWLYS